MHALRKLVSHAAMSLLLLHGAGATAAPVDLNGRGVFRFASSSGCPAGGMGAAHTDCNRIALDLQDAHAALDTTARTIVFSSKTADKDIVVGDVLLQGSGVAKDGRRVPLSLQVLLRRDKQEWHLETYVHAPVDGKFTDVTMDPYGIGVSEGGATRVLMTPEVARKLFAEPAMRKRLARSIVSVRASDGGDPATGKITVGLGLGRVSASVLQAGFKSTGTSDAMKVDGAFQSGNWEVELDALSSHLPRWAVQRELFLFGLEDQPALRTVRSDGFKNHDTLAFGAKGGKGYLRFNGRETPFDGAEAAGHAFMQESFMGLILAWRRDTGTPAPTAPKS